MNNAKKKYKLNRKRNTLLYLFLNIGFGLTGIHNFYLGENKRGLFHLFTGLMFVFGRTVGVWLNSYYIALAGEIAFAINIIMTFFEIFRLTYLDNCYRAENNYWDKVIKYTKNRLGDNTKQSTDNVPKKTFRDLSNDYYMSRAKIVVRKNHLSYNNIKISTINTGLIDLKLNQFRFSATDINGNKQLGNGMVFENIRDFINNSTEDSFNNLSLSDETFIEKIKYDLEKAKRDFQTNITIDVPEGVEQSIIDNAITYLINTKNQVNYDNNKIMVTLPAYLIDKETFIRNINADKLEFVLAKNEYFNAIIEKIISKLDYESYAIEKCVYCRDHSKGKINLKIKTSTGELPYVISLNGFDCVDRNIIEEDIIEFFKENSIYFEDMEENTVQNDENQNKTDTISYAATNIDNNFEKIQNCINKEGKLLKLPE